MVLQIDDRPKTTGLDIVVVDDDEDSAAALAELLQIDGHRLRIAHRGQDALDLLAQQLPQVVFLDLRLPDMGGNEVATAVRTRFGNAVRLVALTGLSGDKFRADARAAGFDSFIVKPPALEALQKALLPQT